MRHLPKDSVFRPAGGMQWVPVTSTTMAALRPGKSVSGGSAVHGAANVPEVMADLVRVALDDVEGAD